MKKMSKPLALLLSGFVSYHYCCNYFKAEHLQCHDYHWFMQLDRYSTSCAR